MVQVAKHDKPRIGPTEQGPGVRAPMGLGSEQYAEAQKVAASMGDMAQVIGQYAALNARAKVTQELADFTAKDAQGYNDFRIDFRKEVNDRLAAESDSEFVGPAEDMEAWSQRRYREWSGEHGKNVTSGLSQKGAREEAQRRLKLTNAGRLNELKLDALEEQADYIEAGIPKMIVTFVQQGNTAAASEYITELREDGLLDADRAKIWEGKIAEYAAKWAKETATAELETQWLAIMDTGGPQEEAQKLVKQAYDAGAISADERIKQDNKVETAFARHSKKAAMEKFDRVTQTYKDFAARLIGADVSYDDVERAEFDGTPTEQEKKRENWHNIIKASDEAEPKRTSAGGTSAMQEIVTQYSRGLMSVHTAYTELVNARFSERILTDDDYTWAIGRLENPYPKHVAVDLAAIQDELDPGWFSRGASRRKAQYINSALVNWVDGQLAENKTPTVEEMYKYIAPLRASDNPGMVQMPQQKDISAGVDEERKRQIQAALDNGWTIEEIQAEMD